MKKQIFLYILPVFVLLNACIDNKVDDLFDESPEARTNSEISSLKKDLIASEYGWLAEYYYNDSSMHTTLVFDFKENDRVVIKSVFEEYLEKECNFNIKYAQQLDLTFDSYSVLAFLMDQTHYADFRWEFEESNENEYKFISRADKSEGISYLTLKKGDETTNTHLEEQRIIHSVRQKLVHNKEKSFFRNLRTNASPYGYRFTFNQFSDEATFYGVVGGALAGFTTKVKINGDGTITLVEPLDIDGALVRKFTYNKDDDAFIISDSDGVDGAIFYDDKPFVTLATADVFLGFNFSYVTNNSYKVENLLSKVKADIPTLLTSQFYKDFGILLVASPAPDGTNKWDGFKSITYEKLSHNLVYLNATNKAFYKTWFEPVYNSNASLKTLFDDFYCSPDGLFIEIVDGKVYLVSKADPSLYVEVTKVN